MARPPRIEFDGALYHVTSRGNARQCIFLDQADRLRFLAQLAESLELFDVLLLAYVLMDNHYHLLVRTPRANLSRFMQRLNTSYALYARFRHERPGHLLQGRYHARLVDGRDYLLAVTRYIHLNPVKTEAALRMAPRERVRLLNRYRWSSYRAYTGAAKGVVPLAGDALEEYGGTGAAARRRYRHYVEACVTKDDSDLVKALRENRISVGDDAFTRRVADDLRRRRTGLVTDGDVAWPADRRVSLDDIDAAVSGLCGVEQARLRQHGRRAGLAKAVAVELAVHLSGGRMRDIGRHYGNLGPSAVTMLRRRLRGRMLRDGNVQRMLSKLRNRLQQSEK